MGLANEALPAEQVYPAARTREFLAAAPVSVAVSKRLLWEGLTTGIDEMYRREFELFAWIGAQADAREGVESFMQKRDPDWKLAVSSGLPDLLDKTRRREG